MAKYIPHRATGSAAINSTLTPPDCPIEIICVKLHLSAAGGAAEDFTVTIDSNTAAAYDVKLFSQDMTTVQDILWLPNRPIPNVNRDPIVFAYANSNGRTYGLEAIYRRVEA